MSTVDRTSLEVRAKGQPKSVGRLLRLTRQSTVLVWHAAPRPFLALIVLQIVGALALAGQVLVVKLTLDAILDVSGGTSGLGRLVLPVLLLALMTAVTAVTTSLQVSIRRYVGEAVAFTMWQRVLDVATGVSLRRFDSSDFFDRLQRVQTSALTRPYQVTNGVISAAGALASSIGLAIVIASFNPALLPLLVLGGLPMLLTSRRESRIEFDFTVAQTERIRMRMYLAMLQTGRDEAKEVRAFGLAGNFRRRFNGLYTTYLRDLAQHLRRRSVLNLLGNLGAAVVLGLTLFVLVWLIDRGSVGVAAAGAAIVAIRMLAGQIQGIFSGVQSIFESGLFLDDLDEFVAGAPPQHDDPDLRVPPAEFRQLRTEDVSFRYAGREEQALTEVSIEINRGEVVALVGENGSGKTTLAKVIAGLYDVDGGRITWDGEDAEAFRPTMLREQIAVIFQDFVRYALSGTENVSLGRPDAPADEDDVRTAARATGADGFLSTLPDGYGTTLSRLFAGGHELSGGQWQRVALARAYYRDAPLVILDEPSAALDPRAEYELFASLRDTLAGRTALFISHRFSSVRSADRIYVLEHGRVTEHGSHEELMARDGHYAELFRLQAAAYLGDSDVRA